MLLFLSHTEASKGFGRSYTYSLYYLNKRGDFSSRKMQSKAEYAMADTYAYPCTYAYT